MRKLLYSVLILALLASLGCAITNYGVITDDRGDYSGVIRTGHKAYIIPTSQTATTYPDGSDELFSMVTQNQYADRTIYTFNNFDPTATALFLDQTYCDWRYEGCEIIRARDPHQDHLDDPFDNEQFPECDGFRSLSLFVDQAERVGECGDRIFSNRQDLAAEFAELPTTTFRGETAYVVPMNDANTAITLTNTDGLSFNVPLYGQHTGFITNKLQFVATMTPNSRFVNEWLRNYATEHGSIATAEITYGSLSGNMQISLATDGLAYNASRF